MQMEMMREHMKMMRERMGATRLAQLGAAQGKTS